MCFKCLFFYVYIYISIYIYTYIILSYIEILFVNQIDGYDGMTANGVPFHKNIGPLMHGMLSMVCLRYSQFTTILKLAIY